MEKVREKDGEDWMMRVEEDVIGRRGEEKRVRR